MVRTKRRDLMCAGLLAFLCGFAWDAAWPQGFSGTAPGAAVAAGLAPASVESSTSGPARIQAASEPATAPHVIDRGFLFIGGRYVEAPYRIEIKELSIIVNGTLEVNRSEPLTILQPHLPKDPGPPPGLQPESNFGELMKQIGESKDTYLYEKWEYLVATIAENDKRNEAFIAYVKSLPPVVDVKVLEGLPGFDFKLRDGHWYEMLVDPPGKVEPPPRDIGKELASERNLLEQLLNLDCGVFYGSTGGMEAVLGREVVAASFPAAIEILQSDRPAPEKIELLQRASILPSGRIMAMPERMSNFKSNEQLNSRIKGLIEKLHARPLSVKEVETTQGHYTSASTATARGRSGTGK